MKNLILITLSLIFGVVPFAVWLCYAGYMLFYLGPHAGWISDEFFRVEGISLVWVAITFIGVFIAAFISSFIEE